MIEEVCLNENKSTSALGLEDFQLSITIRSTHKILFRCLEKQCNVPNPITS